MTYRSHPFAQNLLINIGETKNWEFLIKLILDWDLKIFTRDFLLWIKNMESYLWIIVASSFLSRLYTNKSQIRNNKKVQFRNHKRQPNVQELGFF